MTPASTLELSFKQDMLIRPKVKKKFLKKWNSDLAQGHNYEVIDMQDYLANHCTKVPIELNKWRTIDQLKSYYFKNNDTNKQQYTCIKLYIYIYIYI